MLNIFKFRQYFALFQPSLGGAEGLLISAALSGVGAIMQKNSADAAANKQQRIIRQGQEEDMRLSKQREGAIQGFAADNFTADKRDANYEAGAAKNEASLVKSLTDANAGSRNDVARDETEGNLSGDYLRAKGAATAQSTADILKRAKLMARQNASSLLYNQDATAASNLNADTAGYNSASKRNQSYTNTRVAGARDRGSLVGGLLQAVAPAAGAAGGAYLNRAPSVSGFPTKAGNVTKYYSG